MVDETKSPNFAAMFGGLRVTSFQAERLEDPTEQAHRLRKDFITFLAKDVAAFVAALVASIVIGGYSLFVIASRGPASADGKAMLPLLTAMFGAVVGLAFGKATK